MPRIALGLASLLVLSACTQRVPIELRVPPAAELAAGSALASVSPALTFTRGRFADRRPDTTRLATFKQQAVTYHLFGERPIQDAIFDGLNGLLTNAGHRWVGPDSSAQVRVDLHLLNVQAARNAGMIQVGATSSVQVRLDFVDVRTGQVLHSDIYNGTDDRDQALVGLMSMVRDSINASITKCLDAVAKDARLAAALRTRSTG